MVLRQEGSRPTHLLRDIHKVLEEQGPRVDRYGNPIVSLGALNRFVVAQADPFAGQISSHGGDEGETYPEFKVGGEGNILYQQADGSWQPIDPDLVEQVLRVEAHPSLGMIDPSEKSGNGHRSSRRPRGDIRPTPTSTSNGRR